MRIAATKNRKRKKKYPYRIYLDNGRQIPVPSSTISKIILFNIMGAAS